MTVTTTAQRHADTLSLGACKQIIEYCDLVVNHYHGDMTIDETKPFYDTARGLRAILAMQSPDS